VRPSLAMIGRRPAGLGLKKPAIGAGVSGAPGWKGARGVPARSQLALVNGASGRSDRRITSWVTRSGPLNGVSVYRFPAPLNASGLLGYALEFGYATFAMLALTLWVAMRKGLDVIHAANEFAIAEHLANKSVQLLPAMQFAHHDE